MRKGFSEFVDPEAACRSLAANFMLREVLVREEPDEDDEEDDDDEEEETEDDGKSDGYSE